MSSSSKIIRGSEAKLAAVPWQPVETGSLVRGAAPDTRVSSQKDRSQGFTALFQRGLPPSMTAVGQSLLPTSSASSKNFQPGKSPQSKTDFVSPFIDDDELPEAVDMPAFTGGESRVIHVHKQFAATLKNWNPAEFKGPEVEVEVEAPDFSAMQEAIITETLAMAKIQAQEQAERVVGVAQQQADEIYQKAMAEASEVTRQAYREGMSAAQAEATELLGLARKIVDEVRDWRAELLAQGEPIVLNLVQDIARKVFGNGLVLDPETLNRSFERALVEAKSLGDLRIRAHPEDVAVLGPLWPSQHMALTGQRIDLVPNQDVERGGCYIEGQFGSVDARVHTQFNLVTETLGNVLASDTLASSPFTTYAVEDVVS